MSEPIPPSASPAPVALPEIDAGIARLEAVLAAGTRRKVEAFERRVLDDA